MDKSRSMWIASCGIEDYICSNGRGLELYLPTQTESLSFFLEAEGSVRLWKSIVDFREEEQLQSLAPFHSASAKAPPCLTNFPLLLVFPSYAASFRFRISPSTEICERIRPFPVRHYGQLSHSIFSAPRSYPVLFHRTSPCPTVTTSSYNS